MDRTSALTRRAVTEKHNWGETPMKQADIDQFERLQGQLESFHQELVVLVKKSPNDALNKFKLGLINSLLEKSNKLLGNKKPFGDFDHFDEAAMPSNSDVLLIVSQYLSSFEKLRSDNIRMESGWWYWNVEDADWESARYRTSPPRKISA
jgi:hypothetical protein